MLIQYPYLIVQVVNIGVIMDLQSFLENWGKKVPGIVAVAIVQLDGTPVAGFSNDRELDLMVPAAYFTEVVKSSKGSFDVTGWGEFEDVLISSDTHYIVMRMLNEHVYFGASIDATMGNLGILRLKMKAVMKQILEFVE